MYTFILKWFKLQHETEEYTVGFRYCILRHVSQPGIYVDPLVFNQKIMILVIP